MASLGFQSTPVPPAPGPCTTEQNTTPAQQAKCEQDENVGMGVFVVGVVAVLVLGLVLRLWLRRRFRSIRD